MEHIDRPDARASAPLAHQLGAARLAIASFIQSALCRAVLARLDPLHALAFEGQTLARGLTAKADLQSALAEIEELASRARPDARAPAIPGARARMSPPLIEGAERRGAPTMASAALGSIMERFGSARDSVLSIHNASESFEASLRAMPGDALASLGAALSSHSLAQGLSSLALDPLSAGARLSLLSGAALGQPTATTAPPHADANQAGLGEARAALTSLRALRARSALAREQCRATIDEAGQPPAPGADPEALAFLDRWMEKLRHVSREGQHAAAAIGLAKLRKALDDQARLESLDLERARAPLDELADLRGRFDAFKAKARALSAQGRPLPQSAQSLQDACRQALAARPAPLSSLRKAQRAFEACVSELGS